MTIGSSYFCSYARTISFAIARGRFAEGNSPSTSTGAGEIGVQSFTSLVSSKPATENFQSPPTTEMLCAI